MILQRSARTTLASRVLTAAPSPACGPAQSAFGICDTTVQRRLDRFDELGLAGLQDRTSRPHRQPLKTAPSWAAQILEPRKVRTTAQRIARA